MRSSRAWSPGFTHPGLRTLAYHLRGLAKRMRFFSQTLLSCYRDDGMMKAGAAVLRRCSSTLQQTEPTHLLHPGKFFDTRLFCPFLKACLMFPQGEVYSEISRSTSLPRRIRAPGAAQSCHGRPASVTCAAMMRREGGGDQPPGAPTRASARSRLETLRRTTTACTCSPRAPGDTSWPWLARRSMISRSKRQTVGQG